VRSDHRVARDYDRIASSYARELGDELTGKPLDRALLAYVVAQAGGRGPIGDLGCGPGHVARYVADLGGDVLGIDLSPEMVRIAGALHPHLSFIVGDIRCLPLPDGSLAAALALYSIIHFEADDDIRAACNEIGRVLAPEGEVMLAYHRGDHVVLRAPLMYLSGVIEARCGSLPTALGQLLEAADLTSDSSLLLETLAQAGEVAMFQGELQTLVELGERGSRCPRPAVVNACCARGSSGSRSVIRFDLTRRRRHSPQPCAKQRHPTDPVSWCWPRWPLLSPAISARAWPMSLALSRSRAGGAPQ
jgi:SAM-dependent methyltransferase